MKADILNLKKLFSKDVRYLIPTFQRPYVWNEENQWEPLWTDVRNISEEYLSNLKALGEDNQVAAEERTGSHFLGAVVVQQKPNPAVEIENRDVIDGQQRLTTLQLLLDAAQEVLEQGDWPKEAKQLKRLVLNDEDFTEDNPDHAFKVWPTLVDRDVFRDVMTNGTEAEGLNDAPILLAHEFFKEQVRNWLEQPQEIADARAHALVTALMGLLEMVVIDLEVTDEANVIFETLNARGTPLLDSDLIKNAVLHTASQEGLKPDEMYRKYWKDFDQSWWRADVRQGRIIRPRIDVFLNYWLTMRVAGTAEIQATRFFPEFRKYLEGRNVVDVVADIQLIGETYKLLDSIDDFSPEGIFLYRWHVLDAGVSTPVILWLFSHRETIERQQFLRALNAIESFLVRRMICRMTTKDYSKLFLELVNELSQSNAEPKGDQVVRFLASQGADSRIWPRDAEVRESLLNSPLYRLLTVRRLRMVLEAIEDDLRSQKTEEEHVRRRKLTVEHVLPRGWRTHWELVVPEGMDQEQAEQQRDRIRHTIGNLTLVNDRLNPAMSHAPWHKKRKELEKHSVLLLNRKLLESADGSWSEALIRARGEWITDLVVRIWPLLT